EELTGIRADLLAHTRESRRSCLEVGDADRVFERHPEREAASDGFGQLRRLVAGAAPRIERGDAFEPIEIQRGVCWILIVDRAPDAFEYQRLHRCVELAHSIEERLQLG